MGSPIGSLAATGSMLALLLAAGVPATATEAPTAAEALHWERWSDVRTVEVVTEDEDGSTRETTVWLAVVDGQGYIRTGSTRWGANLERDPLLLLRVAGRELPLRVEFVEDETARQAVIDAMRAKYGWNDWLIGPFRGSHPKIMRLLPRERSGS
jgi:hypothetical protein